MSSEYSIQYCRRCEEELTRPETKNGWFRCLRCRAYQHIDEPTWSKLLGSESGEGRR